MSKALLYELGKSISYGRLPLLAKVLWPMLLAASDDQGRGVADTDVVKWHVCPNVNELTPDTINGALQEMLAQEMIILYEEDGRNRMLYQIVRWWEYQKPQWARPSRYAPPDGWEDRIRCRIKNDYVERNWKDDSGDGSPEQPPEQPPEQETEPTIESESNLIESNLNDIKTPSAANAPPPPKAKPKRKSQKPPTPKQQAARAMFSALAGICQINLTTLTGTQRNQLNQSEKILRKDGATPADMEPFAAWWYANDWRGKKGDAPRPAQVRETWGKFKAWREGGQRKNGARSAPDEWLARRQEAGIGGPP